MVWKVVLFQTGIFIGNFRDFFIIDKNKNQPSKFLQHGLEDSPFSNRDFHRTRIFLHILIKINTSKICLEFL